MQNPDLARMAMIISPPALAPLIPAPAAGKPFTISFDGAVLTGSIAIGSVRDIDRLIKVLQAQKASFAAMQDDEGTDVRLRG